MDGAVDPKANIMENKPQSKKVQVIDNDPQENSMANASIAKKWDINLRIVVS